MRGYVITGSDHVLEHTETIGITSSRKHAIEACEEYLKHFDDEFKWDSKGKHIGRAIAGDHEVRYEMFFINRLEKLED